MNQMKSPWRGLLATAAQIGVYSWLEAWLSSLLGEWATAQSDPEYKLELCAQSAQHRWHSELFFDRLPVLSVVHPEDLVRPPNSQFESFLALVGSASSHSDQSVALYAVLLPFLLSVYNQELQTLSEVADASAQRNLSLVVADLEQELAQHGTGVEGGSELQRDLEQALQASPGLLLVSHSVTDDT